MKFEMSDTFRDAGNNSKAYIHNALETKTNSTSSGSTEAGATKITDAVAEKTTGMAEVDSKEVGTEIAKQIPGQITTKTTSTTKKPPVHE